MWEYRVVREFPNGSEMNKLGKEGWELVSVTVVSSATATPCWISVFKRPLNE